LLGAVAVYHAPPAEGDEGARRCGTLTYQVGESANSLSLNLINRGLKIGQRDIGQLKKLTAR